MKLECFFKYLKEIKSFHVSGTYNDTVYIYEYSVKRYGFLNDKELILYMVVKANKDGFASNNNIKKGFYTLGQAVDYVVSNYNISSDFGINDIYPTNMIRGYKNDRT